MEDAMAKSFYEKPRETHYEVRTVSADNPFVVY